MKLDMVGIIVNDMTQALFYQTLGFNVLEEASPDYTELQNNGVRISFKFTTNDYWCLWVCA